MFSLNGKRHVNGQKIGHFNSDYIFSRDHFSAARNVLREAGIDVPSNTDKLAYIVLKQITMRMPDEPISEDV